jgi:catechol 2,3-dioxygenase
LQGFADHLVSESLYLADPEGNGIEIYADRPRSSWVWEAGEVRMATDPLDLDGLAADAAGAEPWSGLPHDTVVGHVHLEGIDLGKAVEFYAGLLGFDVTVSGYPGARFFSAGGYHHHLAVNVWAAANRPASRDARGLIDYELVVPGRDALPSLRRGLEGFLHARSACNGDRFRVEDPFGIGVAVKTDA